MAVPAAVKAGAKLLTTKDGRKLLQKLLLAVSCFILLTVLLLLMPVILLGAATFPDVSTPEGAAIAAELDKAMAVDFTPLEEAAFLLREQEAKQGVTLSEGDTWSSGADIDVAWSLQELLILYEMLHGTHTQEPLDFSEFYARADSLIDHSFGITATQMPLPKEHEDDEQSWQYHFGYTARLKSFEQLMDALALTEVQKARARLMQQYLYSQNQTGVSGNDPPGIQLGDITYTDGLTPVVYYSQQDERWNTVAYGATGTIGRSGCGPAAMAIVISSLTGSTVTPPDVAAWAAVNGFYSEGGGSYHSLIPAAAKQWGVPVKAAGSDWQLVADALADGKLVVAIMGPGSFTSSGHYIVLRGVTGDGRILAADPASVTRSEKRWDAQTVVSEARKGAGAGGPFWICG